MGGGWVGLGLFPPPLLLVGVFVGKEGPAVLTGGEVGVIVIVGVAEATGVGVKGSSAQ